MHWALSFLGAVSSALLMLLLAVKWKFPGRSAVIGAASVAILVALPFARIYAGRDAGWGLGVGILVQIVVTVAVGLALILLRFWRDPESSTGLWAQFSLRQRVAYDEALFDPAICIFADDSNY